MSGKLKEVRERIKSVSSTQQITKAMKMVSAAKLRKAQQAITEMRPYANRLDKILKNILSVIEEGGSNTFGVEREVSKVAIVVVTSNRGLCGAFNTNIIKTAIARIESDYATQLANGNLKVYCIGKKGFDILKKRYGLSVVDNTYLNLFSDLSFDNVSTASTYLMNAFAAKQYDRIEVCYGQFKNAGVQNPIAAQFLPVEKIQIDTTEKSTKADYIFEPSSEELLAELIPTILQTTFHKFLLDTHASEHGARMTAMDKATENAEEMIKSLKVNYNKARQEAITKELSEIVGGAAALS
ncbi:MAG TPA: ATP synthase F1 subunit gamma [Saprospiraceae bacterium]|nr:ATP synthase F1 subunit gamma [Saprospiraceae bacterium]